MAELRQGSPLGFGGREWATTINISCKLVCCILSPVQWTEWTICKFKSPYFSVHLDGRFTSLPRHPWSEPWKISAKLLGTKKISWVSREMCPFLRIYKFLVGYNTHRRLTLRYLLELYLCYTYTASPNTNTIYISLRHSVNPLSTPLWSSTFNFYRQLSIHLLYCHCHYLHKIWKIPALFSRTQ